MLIDVPEDIAVRAAQEATKSGRSLQEVLHGILRRALGLTSADDSLAVRDDSSEDTLSVAPGEIAPNLERRALAAFARSGDSELDAWSDDEVMDFAVREARKADGRVGLARKT